MSNQVAVVTGVSSGIGRSVALGLAAAGFRVFGTVRQASAELPKEIEKLVVDVRDSKSVEAAVAEVKQKAGRIDLLVNNAGGSLLGAIEECDIEQAQALFDVNFFGVARMTRAVLPVMRDGGGGRVLMVSSVVGFIPAPFMGYYAASKHAIEGYSETLDHEVRAFGVRVVLIEPGFMKTRIDANATMAARPLDAYGAARTRATAGIAAAVEHGDDPGLVATAVVEAATASSPKRRYTVGKGTGALATLRSFMPAGLFDKSLRKQMKLDA